MNNKKKEVTEAILYFANKVEKFEGYNIMVRSSPLPELVKNIIYDLFVYGYVSFNENWEDNTNYEILQNYTKELKRIGYVTFQ